MTYDDSYIEHWGEVYRASAALRLRHSFEQFLTDPRAKCLALLAGGGTLLPRQRAVQRRIDDIRRSA